MKSTRIFCNIILKTFWFAVGLIFFLTVGLSPAAATLVDTSPLAIDNPVPSLISLSPTTGTAGRGAFVLTVNGNGFVSGSSTVRWKGSNRVTTFVSGTQLKANILAADVATPGTAAITVFTAAPGGGTSNPLSFTIVGVSEIPSTEYGALAALYNSANGDSWNTKTGWLVTNTPCSWHGVSCSAGHVTSLRLWMNNLTGSIPAQLGNLSQLTSFDLWYNQLTGGIPTQLGNLTNLTSLDLSSNQLTGSIPGQLGSLTNLTNLNLSDNLLTGSIPAQLGSLTNLAYLYLSYNQLTGPLPSQLRNLVDIYSFYFDDPAVCAPDTADFIAWLESIPNHTVYSRCFPAPTISSISPTSGTAGGAAFVLTVTGTGYMSGSSTVRWNGEDRVTTFASSTKLIASILATDVATPGTAAVTVFTSSPGGGTSVQSMSYTISNMVPTVSSIYPTSGPAGGAGFVLTVAGTGFVSGSSTVRWKGSNRVTTFVSSTKLRANILATDVATSGTAAVTVFTTAPGGGTSIQSVSYSIVNPVPTVSSIYPTSGSAGGTAFVLTVAGTGFVSGSSTVRWKGSNRVTTFVSSTKLRANILAADVATGGTAAVTVFTSSPGGGKSLQIVNYSMVSPLPAVSAISPTSGATGGPAFILTVAGTGFVSGSSTVRWKGADRVTTFVSSTKLRANILAADLATGGTAAITVFTAAPGGGTSVQTVSYAVLSPVPTVSAISPTSGLAGGTAFTLTVAGTGFVSGLSTVRWKGSNRVTTFVSSTKLRAIVLAADVATLGSAAISVFTAAPGGGISVQTVSYTMGNPVPTVSSISPASGTAGRGAFVLTVTGTGFVSGLSTIRWRGSNLATTFVSSTKLSASIMAADVATAGSAVLTVYTDAPGGGTSNALTFTILGVTEIPSNEYGALVALYQNTAGDSWTDKTGWLVTNTPCSWYGITCSAGHVNILNLTGNQLTGSIPTELGNLTNLTKLNLYDNQLTGSIPSQLGSLTNLDHLSLGDNQLTGIIPTQLGSLTNLTWLNIGNNQLTGIIPTQLSSLTNLTILWLSDNLLNGSIPSQLGTLTHLYWLSFSGNQLTGSIPAQLGNLTDLSELYFNDNLLTGNIPSELGNLTNLTLLDLSGNQLGGPMPDSLQNLALLEFYNFPYTVCAPNTWAFLAWLDALERHSTYSVCP